MHEYPNLLIGIGASAGGFEPLLDILSSLPADLQAVIVVIKHRDGARHSQLAAIVAHHSELAVREPVDGESLSCMCVYVGQPNEIIEIEGRKFGIHLDGSMQRKLQRIDDLFSSIAKAAGVNSVGIILSGHLDDGTQGMADIASAGGTCIVQSSADAECVSMPESASKDVICDFIGSAPEIASYIEKLASGRRRT